MQSCSTSKAYSYPQIPNLRVFCTRYPQIILALLQKLLYFLFPHMLFSRKQDKFYKRIRVAIAQEVNLSSEASFNFRPNFIIKFSKFKMSKILSNFSRVNLNLEFEFTW